MYVRPSQNAAESTYIKFLGGACLQTPLTILRFTPLGSTFSGFFFHTKPNPMSGNANAPCGLPCEYVGERLQVDILPVMICTLYDTLSSLRF